MQFATLALAVAGFIGATFAQTYTVTTFTGTDCTGSVVQTFTGSQDACTVTDVGGSLSVLASDVGADYVFSFYDNADCTGDFGQDVFTASSECVNFATTNDFKLQAFAVNLVTTDV